MVSAIILSACTSNSRPELATGSSSVAPESLTWAFEQEFSSFNLNTPEGGTQANLVVLNGVLTGFYQFGPDGALIPTTEFGTYRKVRATPLTVEYRINPKAVWSDGIPITCEDMVFAWLAQSGVTGKKGFATGSTLGMEDLAKPRCGADGRTVTTTYRRPYADWSAQFGVATILPAHVVAKQGGLTKSFAYYADHPSSPELSKAIAFYNRGWLLKPGELKKDLMPSSGPYVIDSWTAGQSLTLKANPRWWGTPAKTRTIVIRFIAGSAQALALQNGEIQVMDPQPQADLIRQLRAMGDSIELTTGESFRYEHLDFGFNGVFRDRSLREAFARCVPRQLIVDNLVRSQNPKAKIMQSRFVFPFQPEYATFENGVGGQRYDQVDLAGARALLGGRRPTVRIGWYKDPAALNKRRADTVALIRQSCAAAGFTIVDAGDPTFFEKEWAAGNFDVAMYASYGTSLVAGNVDYFRTGGGQNPTGYSNRRVDRLLDRLVTQPDQGVQVGTLLELDSLLWADLATIPLFAFPAVVATRRDVRAVEFNSTMADLTWNVGRWGRG